MTPTPLSPQVQEWRKEAEAELMELARQYAHCYFNTGNGTVTHQPLSAFEGRLRDSVRAALSAVPFNQVVQEPTEEMFAAGLRAAHFYDTVHSRIDLSRAYRAMLAAAQPVRGEALPAEQPQSEIAYPVVAVGEINKTALPVYVASRASLPARPAMWQDFRNLGGWNITSSWIDEAGPGETADFTELWARIEAEIRASVGLILYAEAEDFPLKGALIECGIAIGMGKPVCVVLPGVDVSGDSLRPIGSWIKHSLVTRYDNCVMAHLALERAACEASAGSAGSDKNAPESSSAVPVEAVEVLRELVNLHHRDLSVHEVTPSAAEFDAAWDRARTLVAQPPQAVQEVRMLTRAELFSEPSPSIAKTLHAWEITQAGAVIIQRKFCEVNSLKLAAISATTKQEN